MHKPMDGTYESMRRGNGEYMNMWRECMGRMFESCSESEQGKGRMCESRSESERRKERMYENKGRRQEV